MSELGWCKLCALEQDEAWAAGGARLDANAIGHQFASVLQVEAGGAQSGKGHSAQGGKMFLACLGATGFHLLQAKRCSMVG